MPGQNRHVSEQSVGTPPEFVAAAARKLHIAGFSFDLAADEQNTKVSWRGNQKTWFDVQDNALVQDWRTAALRHCPFLAQQPWNWLNPPFANIAPWAEKCLAESERGVCTAMLVPASTGTNWWNDFVWGYAYVLALRSRIQFIGHTDAYPKDLALILYTPTGYNGMDTWDWLAELDR